MDTELTFARKEFQKLPEVPSFKCSTEGAVATFTRTVDNEKIVVTLDTNSGVEMDLMGGEMAESSMDNDIDDDTEVRVHEEKMIHWNSNGYQSPLHIHVTPSP